MEAKKCRSRLSTIQQSYDGHMAEMLSELDELERLASIAEKAEIARKEANNAIYLNDRSDYIRCLWDICKILGMEDEEIGMEYLED